MVQSSHRAYQPLNINMVRYQFKWYYGVQIKIKHVPHGVVLFFPNDLYFGTEIERNDNCAQVTSTCAIMPFLVSYHA